MLEEGRNVWCVCRADKFSLIVDAQNYFRHAADVMRSSQTALMMVGWDVDPRISLIPDRDRRRDKHRLSDFMCELVEETSDLAVWILRWRGSAIPALFRGVSIISLIKWWWKPRITLRMDGAHPLGATHHQKLIVADDSFAFCGGIDMTKGRWDTREHLDEDLRRHSPHGARLGPWHDATAAVTGPAAQKLGEICRERWQRSGAEPPPTAEPHDYHWPDALPVQFENIEIGIARTYPMYGDRDGIYEIEQLYLDMIASAKRYIYAESQYFASRAIAEAIMQRLKEDDPPEIVVVNPVTAEGWLEPVAMDSARNRLMTALDGADDKKRLRLYHPLTEGGEPIYVHAKIMIVDDRLFRVGSSNLNNRSMRLDSECDMVIDLGEDGATSQKAKLRATVVDLLAEHLDVAIDRVDDLWTETGSLIETVETLRGEHRTLKPYERPELSAIEKGIADTELLDPEGAEEMFEPLARRGLFRSRLKRALVWARGKASRGKDRFSGR
ncbi:hypothetical protein B5C34_13265 [Pacificimonas flava]|uniref:Phospholipase D n=2 Tax=Pacificimonas TaxID=1960290 RepID=A0A219B7F7_9SPHN|nr:MULTISPECIES: phospholipase D-like domain-containing protein [Pacificimonas]MBZ6378361.1 phospholipase [Pacificimonas aurantium]OWV34332.1 hypothetical protein B5C34_13265 [Pacificimonas flava]